MSHDNFQPPDPPEPDYDSMADAWLLEKERHGYLVLTRDEFNQRLDSHATDAYAEGRKDEREDNLKRLAWAYRKLMPYSFSKQEDALVMDEIKLMLEGFT